MSNYHSSMFTLLRSGKEILYPFYFSQSKGNIKYFFQHYQQKKVDRLSTNTIILENFDLGKSNNKAFTWMENVSFKNWNSSIAKLARYPLRRRLAPILGLLNLHVGQAYCTLPLHLHSSLESSIIEEIDVFCISQI